VSKVVGVSSPVWSKIGAAGPRCGPVICAARPMVGSLVGGLNCHSGSPTVSKPSDGKAIDFESLDGLGEKAQKADPCSSKHRGLGSREQACWGNIPGC
jgi:hypothetical protein